VYKQSLHESIFLRIHNTLELVQSAPKFLQRCRSVAFLVDSIDVGMCFIKQESVDYEITVARSVAGVQID